MPAKAAPPSKLPLPSTTPPTHFNEAGLRFLRGLPRNNDRAWFEERRAIYERELRQPMLSILATVTEAMASFAPAHVRPPEKALMRIYRDTRFSSDKRPYKNHVAAWWTRRGLEKTSGAGFYFHVSGKEVMIAAGVYMPQPAQLLALRRFLLERHADYRSLIEARPLRRLFTLDEGMPLTRAPKGFPSDHPAEALVRQRQWGVHATLPAAHASNPTFAAELVRYFAVASPLVSLLNAPLVSDEPGERKAHRKPLF